MSTMFRPLLIAALLGAATDTVLTRLQLPHRAADWLLPAQTTAGWLVLALLVWPLAALVARLLGTRLGAAFVCTALPVALHATLRDAARDTSRLMEPGTLLAAGGVLAAALVVVLVTRRIERGAAGDPVAHRTPALWVLGCLVLTAAAMTPWSSERAVAAHAPPAATSPASSNTAANASSAVANPTADRPNLLLLVWDTTRADHLAPYGYDRDTTPHLSALAERSVVFDRAYSATIFTLSSHTSMLTGLPQAAHGTSMTRQIVDVDTLSLQLRAAGYRTGAFVGTSVLRAGGGLERGFDVYDDQVDPPLCDTVLWDLVHDLQVALATVIPRLRGNGNPHWFQDFQRPADNVLASALDFVRADDSAPWFVFVNLFDVHWPYLPPQDARARWVSAYNGPLDGFLFRSDSYPPGHAPDAADKRYVKELYDAEMWQLDRDVDAFLGQLDQERTAVLLTADHGEGLGEPGRDGQLWSHEHLHAPQTHVPLLLAVPGDPRAGSRVEVPVSGVDVAPTLLELAGVTPPPGTVGLSLLAAPDAERIVVIQDHDNMDENADGDAAIRGRFKLLDWNGARTLHDLHTDPLDITDIGAQHPGEVAELGAAIDALHGLEAAADRQGGGMDLDALRALGYVGDPVDRPPPAVDEDG